MTRYDRHCFKARGVPGTEVMTGELDDMFNAELNNSVPGIWTKDGIGYPCLKPLNSWFEDIHLLCHCQKVPPWNWMIWDMSKTNVAIFLIHESGTKEIVLFESDGIWLTPFQFNKA